MTGKFLTMGNYVSFAVPNTYFHLTTAYNILRQLGLKIGKSDFMGTVDFEDDK